MGSLMAGWDSPVLGDDNKVRARRNRSLTKEEVEAFWKQRRSGGEATTAPLGSPGIKTGPSSPAGRVDSFPDDGGAGESPSKSRDWWTRSSWAFLNEPPQEEPAGRAQSYKPQFHVARIATGNA
ncbi:hypothetical protein ACP70R_025754 [Stipagrostis hirtigluma subsp. patula]